MDLSKLSRTELSQLLASIPAEIQKREKEEKAKAIKELEAFAAERGFSLDELLSSTPVKAKKEKGTIAIKYRHPKQANLTWTGRGRQPKWIAEFLSQGGSLPELGVSR